jgi:hypothetical protein
MPLDLRKPGVYVEESLLVNTADTSAATSTALFVGAAGTGPTNGPVRCATWSDYVLNFGGFDPLSDPANPLDVITSYLPYTAYSYFQNGGRPTYIQRAIGADEGTAADYDVLDGAVLTANVTNKALTSNVATLTTGTSHGFSAGQTVIVAGVDATFNGTHVIVATPTATTFTYAKTNADVTSAAGTGTATVNPNTVFTVSARSVGVQGNALGITLRVVDSVNDIFNVSVYKDDVETERFQYLTVSGDTPGTRAVDTAINDPYSGSTLIQVTGLDVATVPAEITTAVDLTGGVDPSLPDATDYPTATQDAVGKIEGPLIVNLVGYTSNKNDPDAYVAPNTVSSVSFPERSDIFVINDAVPPRETGQTSAQYKSQINSTLSQYSADSYVAAYTPWLIVPDPKQAGGTITIPPGGGVAGVISRIDSTIGVFRAPAGIVAAITNAVGVDTKYSDSEMGDFNSGNINVIRPVQGQGVAIMGARTRKVYGADRYISARRTLIYIKESLKRSTQFALFENNDQRLWTQLIMTAERLLRPLWEDGGLRGGNASESYYIKCDETLNTPAVIASGEVRMEIGVALEYPAEFIVIRVTQFESGGFAAEVQPRA